MASLHFVFNYLNTTNGYESFRFWANLSEEAPPEMRTGQVMGLTQEENRKFWAAERRFNKIFNRTVNGSLAVLGVVFNIGLFIDRYEVDIYTYVIVQTIHLAFNV